MDYKDGRSTCQAKKLTDFSIERILSPETFFEPSIRSLYPYYVFPNNFIASYFSSPAADLNQNSWIKDDSLKCNICGKVFAFIFDLSVSFYFYFL